MAYWNQTSVTLHLIVIYYKKTGFEKLLHKSIIVVSDEMSHNAGTVLTSIDQLIPEVKSGHNMHTLLDGQSYITIQIQGHFQHNR